MERPPPKSAGSVFKEKPETGVDPAQQAPLVTVIIPCYNGARFLPEAIESVLRQSYQPTEIIVVDDGSTDATPEVVARFPEVRYVRQENRGVSAARNSGIDESNGEYLVFLDADDRLLPAALETGVACFRNHPECAFVFGSLRWITTDGSIRGRAELPHEEDSYAAMLRKNFIPMPATVMFRREAFSAVGGFNPSLTGCEDYDVYLRMTQRFPVYGHKKEIAEYRQHDNNTSGDSDMILTTALEVLSAQWKHVKSDRRLRKAYHDGVGFWVETYGQEVLWPTANLRLQGSPRKAARGAARLLRYVPRWFIRQASSQVVKDTYRLISPALPARIHRRIRARWPGLMHQLPPPVGRIRFGDLRRTTPIDRWFGYLRGQPIDRYYIERFLAQHAGDIEGHVLETRDNLYTHRFGGERVRHCDVVDGNQDNPQATVVDELTDGANIPSDTYDCFLLLQELQLIYDVRAALRSCYRLLKPGGVLLASVPGITKIDQSHVWYWSFTPASARRLLEEVFPASNVSVEAHGNVLVAQAFLQGLSAAELNRNELDHYDADYPVSIVIRAVKPKSESVSPAGAGALSDASSRSVSNLPPRW